MFTQYFIRMKDKHEAFARCLKEHGVEVTTDELKKLLGTNKDGFEMDGVMYAVNACRTVEVQGDGSSDIGYTVSIVEEDKPPSMRVH